MDNFRHGNPNKLLKNPNGFGSIRKDGYKRITVKGKRFYEHRFIIESNIGRKLKSFETIHHINHNTSDNRIENLEILQNGEHVKLHSTTTFRNKTHKQCTKCFVIKHRNHFYLQKKRHNSIYEEENHSWCKSCQNSS